MINQQIVENTVKNLLKIEGLTVNNEERMGADPQSDFYGKIDFEGSVFLLKLQDESEKKDGKDVGGENHYIFSINYFVNIKKMPKSKKEIDILRAINTFNEKHAIVKAIKFKTEGDAFTFWFRNEQLSNKELSTSVIKDILTTLKNAPKTLTSIMKG